MNWNELKRLFVVASELPSERRAGFVARIRVAPAMRRELRALLEADRQTRGFLDNPPLICRGARSFAGTESYPVESLIGRGIVATVYRSHDTVGASRALKVFDRSASLRPGLRALAADFDALRQLEHRSLVKLDAFVEDGDIRFVATELIEGVCFSDYITAAGGKPSALDCIEQLVDGLASIHAAGRTHGGIKPSNILVTSDGRVRIVDLGTNAAVLEGRASTPTADWRATAAMLRTAVDRGAPAHLVEHAESLIGRTA